MKEIKILIKLNLCLKRLKELGFSFFILLIFYSCNTRNKNNIKIFYYKFLKNNKITAYECRKYNNVNDTINEMIFFFNKKGKLNGDVIKNKYVIKDNGLDIIINQKSTPYFYKKIDSCCKFNHNYFGKTKNCYLGRVNFYDYKNVFKIKHSTEIIDGISNFLYLNNDYTFIGSNDNLLTLFDTQIRINKKEITPKLLLNMGQTIAKFK